MIFRGGLAMAENFGGKRCWDVNRVADVAHRKRVLATQDVLDAYLATSVVAAASFAAAALLAAAAAFAAVSSSLAA